MTSIQVAVRIRPFSPAELQKGKENDQFYIPKQTVQLLDEKVIIFDPIHKNTNPENRLARLATSKRYNKDIKYGFDRVFDMNSTQQHIFQQLCQPLLLDLMNGYHATIFAYGATGAGKTYTITGINNDPGIIFLSLDFLFNKLPTMDKVFQVEISYLEIYNEQLHDLLEPSNAPQLRENGSSVQLANISTHSPQSPTEVMELITLGNKRRSQSPTEANANSSRSHAILRVTIKMRSKGEQTYTESILSIIDLAGSERASATATKGFLRRREGANINRSLLALGNCINALCTNSKGRHIPFRDSKLTRLLKQSLSGNCKTVMICNVSPTLAHYEETHNTLKYANRAKNIKVSTHKNIVNVKLHISKYLEMIKELKEENKELRKQNEQDKMKLEEEMQMEVTQIMNQATVLFDAILVKQREQAQIKTQLERSRIAMQCLDAINIDQFDSDVRIRVKLLINTQLLDMDKCNALLMQRSDALDDETEGLLEEIDQVGQHENKMTHLLVQSELEQLKLKSVNAGLSLELEEVRNGLYTQIGLMAHINNIATSVDGLVGAFDVLRNGLDGGQELKHQKHERTQSLPTVDSKMDLMEDQEQNMEQTPIRMSQPLRISRKHELSPNKSETTETSEKRVKFDLARNITKMISPRHRDVVSDDIGASPVKKTNVFDRLFPSPNKKRKEEN